MITEFINFNEKTYVYPKSFFMDDHKDKEYVELWVSAINIATDNGKKQASYPTVNAIYDNLEKKQIKKEKGDIPDNWIKANYKYWKKLYDLNSKLSDNERKFYKSILSTLKERGGVSYKQYLRLRKLK